MNSIKHAHAMVLTMLFLFSGTAFAHAGHHPVTGFMSGLSHPLTGLDHLLAMIAIGMWAAQQGGRAMWAVPATFVTVMMLGGLLALTGWVLPHVETGIALSVLVLGLLIATRRQWAVTAGMMIAGVFALFHGYAHGLEMPQATSPARYALGFVLSTIFLHGVGLASSVIGRRAIQIAGMGIAGTGLALMLGFVPL